MWYETGTFFRTVPQEDRTKICLRQANVARTARYSVRHLPVPRGRPGYLHGFKNQESGNGTLRFVSLAAVVKEHTQLYLSHFAAKGTSA